MAVGLYYIYNYMCVSDHLALIGVEIKKSLTYTTDTKAGKPLFST